jgi:hypothetical protein
MAEVCMRTRRIGAAVGTVILAASVAPRAQEKPATNEIAVVGCVELERDYRARKESGKGGVLGTGVGVGNEFILTNARMVPGPGKGRSSAAAPSGAARGAPGIDYGLSGRLEHELLRSVGRQVEVVGVVEDDKADDLQVVRINLWHPVGDFCPSK